MQEQNYGFIFIFKARPGLLSARIRIRMSVQRDKWILA